MDVHYAHTGEEEGYRVRWAGRGSTKFVVFLHFSVTKIRLAKIQGQARAERVGEERLNGLGREQRGEGHR